MVRNLGQWLLQNKDASEPYPNQPHDELSVYPRYVDYRRQCATCVRESGSGTTVGDVEMGDWDR